MRKDSVRTIVLTGCTRGLGRALARFFIERGYTVAGCARSRKGIEDLHREFPAPNDFFVVDVSDESGVRNWAQRVFDRFGAPDLLINNAALIAPNGPIWQLNADDFSQVVDVNLKGTFNVIRHFTPMMITRNRGTIINFSSGWGHTTSPDVAAYCATKWAIEGLTQAFAQDLTAAKTAVIAIAVNPGIISTDMLRSCFGEEAERYPEPDTWAKVAGPFLLGLGGKNHGTSVNIPDPK